MDLHHDQPYLQAYGKAGNGKWKWKIGNRISELNRMEALAHRCIKTVLVLVLIEKSKLVRLLTLVPSGLEF